MRRQGVSLVTRSPQGSTVEERFFSKIEKLPEAPGCWLWLGALLPKGHGLFHWDRPGTYHTARAHCVSWELHNGPIPNGLHVLHKCDVPSCVRPDHLYLGTEADNTRDKIARGRDNPVFGERNPQARLTKAIVFSVLDRLRSGEATTSIGRDLGVSSTAILYIKIGRNWRRAKEEYDRAHSEAR